jgi:hypothetical protein
MDSRAAFRIAALSVLAVFVVHLALVIPPLIAARGEPAPYWIADWQINYAGGFVRRGLLGELARLLAVHASVDTRTTIVAMQILFFVAFFGASAALLVPELARHPVFAFAVFSPITFAFKALDPGSGGAKDIVFLALLAIQALLSTRARTDPSASNRRLLVVAAAWAAIVLTHEGFFFYLPFSVALLVLTARSRLPPLKLGLTLLPAILAFLLSGRFHGDPSYVTAICASLGASAPERCEQAGAIAWLMRPANVHVLHTYYQIVKPPYILLTTVMAAMLGGVCLALLALDTAVARRVREAWDAPSGLGLTVACFAFPVLLFALSDHGRYLSIWFSSAVLVLAAYLSRTPLDAAAPAAAGSARGKAGVLVRALWAIVLLAYATTWSAQGSCCPDRLGSGFFGKIFFLIDAHL